MDRVCFATGETVTVRGKTGLWTVIDDDSASNRIIVEQKNSLCVDDTTFDSTLNTWLVLKPREVFSTQLEVRAEPVATLLPNDNYNAIETIIMEATGNDSRGFWDPAPFFNRWIPLRALGGNSILIRPAPSGSRAHPLILFPRIDRLGLEVWFHSQWYGRSTQLLEVDALDLCPQGQYWPKCMWCLKFHLPFDTHRSSRCHRRFHDNYIHPILREELGSARRQQLVEDLRRSTEAWSGPVGNMAHMFVHDH